MKVYRAKSGDWGFGETHYLIAAESNQEAYDYLCKYTFGQVYIDYDSIWHIASVCTNATETTILEEF